MNLHQPTTASSLSVSRKSLGKNASSTRIFDRPLDEEYVKIYLVYFQLFLPLDYTLYIAAE